MNKIKLVSTAFVCFAALALTGCSGEAPEPTPAADLQFDGKAPERERVEVLSTNRVYAEHYSISEVKIDRADGSHAICFMASSFDGTMSLDCPEWVQQDSSIPETSEGKK